MKPLAIHGRIAGLAAIVGIAFSATSLFAHCDTMDGPIVPEAQTALETGDITPILKWVSEEHEAAIRGQFERTRAVRDDGGAVREMADQLFLETLIRLHRQGEGAPYTGLQPAGSMAPVFVAADAALASRDATEMMDRLGAALQQEIHRRFTVALERRAHADDSVQAGRAYVEAYVAYVHFVEELDGLLQHGATIHVLEGSSEEKH